MPIDPTIALGVRPAQTPDLLGTLGQAMQLRHLSQAGQMQDIQLQQAKQEQADQNTMRDTLAQHGGDLTKALPSLAGRISTPTFLKVQNAWLEQEKNRLGNAKTQGEIADRVHESLGKLALGVKASGNRPEAFLGAADTFSKLDPEVGKALTPYVQRAQQDPNSIPGMIDQLIAGTKTGQEERTTVANETRAGAVKTQADTAVNRFNAERPGIETGNQLKADQLKQEQMRSAAGILANAVNDADYQAKRGQQPYAIASLFPEKLDRDAILRVGMTPIEQATREQAAAAAAETARHNKVSEQQGGQRIGIEGQRLSREGATTVMVPNADGSYSVQRVAPGSTVPAGTVTPAGMSSMNVPTAATRGMAEKAPRVIEFANRIEQLLNENESQLGPLNSRWNEFTAGKVGLKNKGYTQLRTDAGLLQTALMQMHVGARGGQGMMEHFKGLLDVATQNPDNLRAALSEIKDYAQRVAVEGGNKGLAGGSSLGGPKVGTVEQGYRFKGGNPADKSNWEKVNR